VVTVRSPFPGPVLYVFIYVHSVAKFIVPEWGDKVDSGTGLSYRPANLSSLAARYNPMPESFIPPVRDYEFGYFMSTYVLVNVYTAFIHIKRV
jgi:hypothetical protein